ncbi:MAG: hypothetical protein NZ849_09740 [Meiothermus sp.]|uniref:hypothetical protein n=1 Tax=Meiothermus sp. TaxID=1955249 RepID=UPI0025ECC494|nr:hypothetical protein [Meiothermus sp.]MCS7059284.1 hypothetical protein [Meiothermus sp.]MCS7195173.1 hypothetical protein [Meiothermus sp.]MCX7740960.1 hypothetical protein [Meiothermus sp.]MDW8091700.1 hypothetical protein [Meiothermus sp.]MDW8482104.1 hypothetical protein [Meiothermus sp.]
MKALKVTAFWVRPPEEAPLPEARAALESLIGSFYQAFPEYTGALAFSQAPRPPHHIFVYVDRDCSGLLPGAGQFLHRLLQGAFPQGEVRAYGRVWLERP